MLKNRRRTIILFIFLLGLGSNLVYFGVRAEISKDAQNLYQMNTDQLAEVNEKFNIFIP